MDRSLYPEGVEVHQRDLERTENTKSFHIIQRHEDTATMGLVSGSIIQNTGDGTLIDINPIFGFTPNGEMIETTTIISALALANYSSGAINYVIAIYTESLEKLQPHETSNDSQPTSATRSTRIRVLTETEYQSLPETDDNLNNDAADRTLIIAKITARGVNTPLLDEDFEAATSFPSAITAINTTENISGIIISNIDKTTNTGNGSLSFEFGTQEIKWKAPGDSVFGAPTLISVSGIFDIISPSNKTITLIVVKSSLPLSDQVDIITISNIYSQNVPRHTSEDQFHRSLLGSGTASLINPHGLTLQDLGSSSGIVEIHQDLFHSNGILKISNPTVLEATIDTGVVPNEIDINSPGISDKFYINGNEFTSIQPTTVLFTDLTDDAHAVFNIYAVEGVGGIAILERRERVRYTTVSTPPFLATYVQLINISKDIPASVIGKIKFDDTADTLEFDSGTGTYGTPVTIPTSDNTVRLYDENDQYYIDINVRSTINGIGTQIENLTIAAPLTDEEDEERLALLTVLYTGSATGFLGYGFGVANAPNNTVDDRLFGTLGLDNIRDDVGLFDIINVTGKSSALGTENGVVIGKLDTAGLSKLEVLATEINQNGLMVESTGTGTGIIGRAGGTGVGIIAEGVQSTPTNASLIIWPQDIEPITKSKGSYYTKTSSGKPYFANGLVYEQLLTRTFVSVVDSSVHTGTVADTALDVAYTIPANTLQIRSVIRIRAMVIILDNTSLTDGVMTLWLGPVGSGIKVGSVSIEMSTTDYQTFLDLTMIMREIGSSGKFVSNGIGGSSELFSSGTVYALGKSAINNINTTVDIDTTISCVLGDTSQQVVLRNLIVEISG